MSHPPIPPNSKYFFEIQNDPYHRNGIWFSLPYIRKFSHDSDFPMLVDPQNENDGGVSADERPIIAAVADVEWDERSRRWRKVIFHRMGMRKECSRQWDSHENCIRNAEAWRAWGKEKS